MMGLRRSRFIGQEKTPLQHIATVAAMKLVRLGRWLNGIPHAKTICFCTVVSSSGLAKKRLQRFATSIKSEPDLPISTISIYR